VPPAVTSWSSTKRTIRKARLDSSPFDSAWKTPLATWDSRSPRPNACRSICPLSKRRSFLNVDAGTLVCSIVAWAGTTLDVTLPRGGDRAYRPRRCGSFLINTGCRCCDPPDGRMQHCTSSRTTFAWSRPSLLRKRRVMAGCPGRRGRSSNDTSAPHRFSSEARCAPMRRTIPLSARRCWRPFDSSPTTRPAGGPQLLPTQQP
jgi:hypothetical protein